MCLNIVGYSGSLVNFYHEKPWIVGLFMIYRAIFRNGIERSSQKLDPCWLKCSGRTAWQRPIGCLQVQVIFWKRATNHRALLQKMTFKDMASYGSSPLCIVWFKLYSTVEGVGCTTRRNLSLGKYRFPLSNTTTSLARRPSKKKAISWVLLWNKTSYSHVYAPNTALKPLCSQIKSLRLASSRCPDVNKAAAIAQTECAIFFDSHVKQETMTISSIITKYVYMHFTENLSVEIATQLLFRAFCRTLPQIHSSSIMWPILLNQ